MTQRANGYSPNSFTIKKGIPVKWIITSESAYSCAASILMPSMNIQQGLKEGENVIEFTPKQVGTLPFSCSMGMYRGSFNVVDDTADPSNSKPDDGNSLWPISAAGAQTLGSTSAAAACGSGGCGCGGGGSSAPRVSGGSAKINSTGVQKIASRDSAGLSPNEFTVSAGKPVEWTITPDGPLTGCMVAFKSPGLGFNVRESYPDPTIVSFTPDTPGDYDVTCPMGMWRATIHVK
jgi:plastocyanin domain-containing protein